MALATPLMGAGLIPLGSILKGWSQLLIAPLVLGTIGFFLARELLRRVTEGSSSSSFPPEGSDPRLKTYADSHRSSGRDRRS